MQNNNLNRFLVAQKHVYDIALIELESGKKRGHWMWFIFPQIAGLGVTETAKLYAITDIVEAGEYLMHPELGTKLIDCCKALLRQPIYDANKIFGTPDDLKLKSSMTLFDAVPATSPIFGQVLAKFYEGEKDKRTLMLLGMDDLV